MRLFRTRPARLDHTDHEIAANWLLREQTEQLTPLEQAELNSWIGADPHRRNVWADVKLAMTVVTDNAAHPELLAMRTAALAARGEGHRNRHGLLAVLALVILVGLSVGVWSLRSTAGPGIAFLSPQRAPSPVNANVAQYQTEVGERSSIALPDGSIAVLDTNSAIRVAYSSAERAIKLVRGQALFQVAKHKAMPFQVYAGDKRVTATGTEFNVRLDGAGTGSTVRVALVEGVVQVSTLQSSPDRDAPVQVITMAPGELLQAKAGAPIAAVAANTDQLTSWRDGLLTFNDTSLGEAVAEINRYTNHPLKLADARLADLRISGVFKSGDPDHFAETVAQIHAITNAHDTRGELVLMHRA